LLDTNIVSYWFDGTCPENSAVVDHIERLTKGTPLAISAVSLGEIEFGLRVHPADVVEFEVELQRFIQDQLPLVLNVTSTTRTYSGALRARVFECFAPRKKRGKRSRAEELADPATGRELGVQENDLWIAAQALEHNLVLVTNDQLSRIREVGGDLRIDNWTTPLEL
jgi:tRNA(fMet)-specific endonuclease VapC